MSSVYLVNKKGERVAVPEETARRLFQTFAMAEAVVSDMAPAANSSSAPSADAENDAPFLAEGDNLDEDEAIRFDELDHELPVLEAVARYAMLPDNMRTASIPKPMVSTLAQCVMPHEMELVQAAEDGDYLVPLIDLASHLRFEQLLALCSAYASTRIEEIARAAPDIMTGAEEVRKFLHMENDWTEEEMRHLKTEMEYAKQVDPNTY